MKTLSILVSEAQAVGVFGCCEFDTYQSAYLDVTQKTNATDALKLLAGIVPVTQIIGSTVGTCVATGREKLVRNYFYPNHLISDRAIMMDLCCKAKDLRRLAIVTQKCLRSIRIGVKKILMAQLGEYVEADYFALTMLYREATTKRCARCGDIKLVSAFAHRHSNSFDRQSWCRECYKVNHPMTKIEATPQISLNLY